MQLTVRRTLPIAALSIALVVGFGYATALVKASDCRVAFVKDLNDRGIAPTGRSYKQVPLTSMEVSTRAAPFVVDVGVTLPRGLNASRFTAKYLTVPWGVVQISRQVHDV